MNIIHLTKDQIEALEELGEGDVISHRHQHGALVIETAHGDQPYIWKDGTWEKL